MKKGIVGKKIGMTQIFDDNGKVIPVTVVEAGPCVVVPKKTAEHDGYSAVPLGFGEISVKNVNKPQKGHFAKADAAAKRTLKEFGFDDMDAYNLGDIIKADAFEPGDIVEDVYKRQPLYWERPCPFRAEITKLQTAPVRRGNPALTAGLKTKRRNENERSL